MLAKEMDLNIVEWINSVNENNIIQRPTMPGRDSWRPSTVDEGKEEETCGVRVGSMLCRRTGLTRLRMV